MSNLFTNVAWWPNLSASVDQKNYKFLKIFRNGTSSLADFIEQHCKSFLTWTGLFWLATSYSVFCETCLGVNPIMYTILFPFIVFSPPPYPWTEPKTGKACWRFVCLHTCWIFCWKVSNWLLFIFSCKEIRMLYDKAKCLAGSACKYDYSTSRNYIRSSELIFWV